MFWCEKSQVLGTMEYDKKLKEHVNRAWWDLLSFFCLFLSKALEFSLQTCKNWIKRTLWRLKKTKLENWRKSQKWGWRGIMWAFHAQSHMLFFRPGLEMSQSCFWRKLWFVMLLLEKLQIVVIYTGHYGKMIWWLQCMCVTWEIRFSFTWC